MKVVGVHVFSNQIWGLTADGGSFSMGDQTPGPCVYGRCRTGNMCKKDHCVGATLLHHGYRIENGTLIEIQRN